LPFDKLKVPSTAEGLGVDPEGRFFSPPSKAGLGAAERVKWFEGGVVNDEFKFGIAFA